MNDQEDRDEVDPTYTSTSHAPETTTPAAAPASAARSSGSRGGMIVVVMVLLGAGAIGAAYTASLYVETRIPVHDDDDAILLRAADLEPFLQDYAVQAHLESIDKVKYADEVIELRYTYQHDASNLQFDIQCMLVILPDRGSARKRFRELKEDPLSQGNVTTQAIDVPVQGDQVTVERVTRSGAADGYRCIYRRHEKVFYVELSGLTLPDDYTFVELISPNLGRVESYQP